MHFLFVTLLFSKLYFVVTSYFVSVFVSVNTILLALFLFIFFYFSVFVSVSVFIFLFSLLLCLAICLCVSDNVILLSTFPCLRSLHVIYPLGIYK